MGLPSLLRFFGLIHSAIRLQCDQANDRLESWFHGGKPEKISICELPTDSACPCPSVSFAAPCLYC
jgi:hypothetical protein